MFEILKRNWGVSLAATMAAAVVCTFFPPAFLLVAGAIAYTAALPAFAFLGTAATAVATIAVPALTAAIVWVSSSVLSHTIKAVYSSLVGLFTRQNLTKAPQPTDEVEAAIDAQQSTIETGDAQAKRATMENDDIHLEVKPEFDKVLQQFASTPIILKRMNPENNEQKLESAQPKTVTVENSNTSDFKPQFANVLQEFKNSPRKLKSVNPENNEQKLERAQPQTPIVVSEAIESTRASLLQAVSNVSQTISTEPKKPSSATPSNPQEAKVTKPTKPTSEKEAARILRQYTAQWKRAREEAQPQDNMQTPLQSGV